MPEWIFDKRKDPEGGKAKHFVMADYDFQIMQELSREKKIRSYRGIRHMFALKCRGQRTRHGGKAIAGRKGKAVGVIKKKEAPKKLKEANKK